MSKKSNQKPKPKNRGVKIGDFLADQKQNLFAKMLNQAATQIVVLDAQGRIVFLNKTAAKAFGQSVKKILLKPITQFMNEKMTVSQWRRKYFTRIKKNGSSPATFTVERAAKGQSIKVIEVSAVLLRYNSADYMLCVGRDITQRLTLENRLKESEDLYRLLSEQAADGIFTTDLMGNMTYANRATKQLTKLDPREITGLHFSKFVEKRSLPKAWESFYKVRRGNSIIRDEIYMKDSKGNAIPVEFTASPILKDGKVVSLHAIVRDITKRKKYEHFIHESDKMRAIQHFIAGTAQEIESPLRGILGHAKNIIDKYKYREFEYIGFKEFKDIMRTLENMRDQVKYCVDTTDRLLGLQKKKAGLKHNFCHVNEAIKESVKLLEHEREVHNVSIKLKLGSHIPRAAIGPIEFNQAVLNILTNAVQSMSTGGNIEVKTAHIKKEGMIRVDCKDEGVGIPKEALTHVYEPFFTTKQRGLEKSSGLGLTIVYSIIKANHGEISIKSSLRHGTNVSIYLPVYTLRKKANYDDKFK